MSTYISSLGKAYIYTTSATISYYTDIGSQGSSEYTYGDWYYTPSRPYNTSSKIGVQNSNPARYYAIEECYAYRTVTSNSVSWVFSDGSTSTQQYGQITITGLTQGSQASIGATVYSGAQYIQYGTVYYAHLYDENENEIYYDYNNNNREWINNGYISFYAPGYVGAEADPGLTPTSSTSSFTTCDDIYVYTRPGNFTEFNNFIGGDNGTVIESAAGLTVGKVNRWIDHCNKFAHWWNQNGSDVISPQSQTTSKCYVQAGDYITVGWYNTCANACANTKPDPVDEETYITPAVISALGAAISADDNTSVS